MIQHCHSKDVLLPPHCTLSLSLDAMKLTVVLRQVPNSHDGRQAIQLQSAHRSESSGILMSCSAKNEMRLFSFAGKQLASVDAAGLHNHMAAISPDGRFFAAATFTSDVKVCAAMHSSLYVCVGQDSMTWLNMHECPGQCLHAESQTLHATPVVGLPSFCCVLLG